MSTKPRVSIVMGSDSDLDIMRETAKALEEFGIEYEIDVTSAHRSPERTAEFARKAAGRGVRVIIAGAGGAAHLAGVIAAHTSLPVIGVPIPSTSLQGMDSLAGDGADASRHSGGDGRHRQARGHQCRHPGGPDSGAIERPAGQKAGRPQGKAGQQRGRKIAKAEDYSRGVLDNVGASVPLVRD